MLGNLTSPSPTERSQNGVDVQSHASSQPGISRIRHAKLDLMSNALALPSGPSSLFILPPRRPFLITAPFSPLYQQLHHLLMSSEARLLDLDPTQFYDDLISCIPPYSTNAIPHPDTQSCTLSYVIKPSTLVIMLSTVDDATNPRAAIGPCTMYHFP